MTTSWSFGCVLGDMTCEDETRRLVGRGDDANEEKEEEEEEEEDEDEDG